MHIANVQYCTINIKNYEILKLESKGQKYKEQSFVLALYVSKSSIIHYILFTEITAKS